MALDDGERAIVEGIIGPLEQEHTADIASRIGRLGSPQAAGLEVLKIRLAEMELSPSHVSAAGDGSVSHTANLKPVKAKVLALAQEVEALGNLTGAAAQLVASVLEPEVFTESIDLGSSSPRRG